MQGTGRGKDPIGTGNKKEKQGKRRRPPKGEEFKK